MGRVALRFMVAAGLLCAAAAASAQDVTWQRSVSGYLEGVQLAMYHGGADYTKPVFADVDGDGHADMFVGEHDGYLNYFKNLGGNPANWLCVSTGLDTIDVGKQCAPAFWDYNNDGKLDMFLGNESGHIWKFLNTGTPTAPVWTLQDTMFAGIDVGYHATPCFADLDGDGLTDLLVGSNSGFFSYFHNSGTLGNPNFTLQAAHYQNIWQIMKSTLTIGDVNSDGLPDLLVSGLNGGIFYYRNNGPATNPTYTNMGMVASVTHNGAPTLWDIDGDGDLDLISGQSDGNLMVWINLGNSHNPSWHFTQDYYGYFDVGYYSMPTLGDLNGDGKLDMLIAKGNPGLHFLQNTGTLDSAAWHLVSQNYGSIAQTGVEAPSLIDMDNDGDLDLVVGSEDGHLYYYQNTGTAQNAVWAAPISNYANVNVGDWSAPTFADLDGDGDKDMLVGSEAGTIRYLRRDGPPNSPVWTDLGNIPGINVGSNSTPAFADLDGDGDLDLLCGNGSNAGNLYFYRNTGSQYLPVWTLVTPVYQNWDFGDHSAPAFADLNHDGRPDLIIGCASGGLYYMMNMSSTHNVNVYVTPLAAPIVIPAHGGWFNYNITEINHENIPVTLQTWIKFRYPSGSWSNPVLGPFTLTLPANFTLSRFRTQEIPGTYLPGDYLYCAFIGMNPVVWDSAYFSFTKLVTGADGPLCYNTTCTGDPFPGEVQEAASLPVACGMVTASPNPFNPTTAISFQLSALSHVSLKVYDTSGRLVATLVDGMREAGTHEATFDGRNLSSGLYLAHLQAGDFATTQKLVLLK
jgi:hypothetical protein